MTQTERTTMVTIGNIECTKETGAGEIKFSTVDVDGNKKEFVIKPWNFKNEAEKVLWTMANNELETNDKPTYEEALEKHIKKECKHCGCKLTVNHYNRNKVGKFGCRAVCRHCEKVNN